MELNYELTKDDYLAFNMHYAEHSKTIQKSLIMQRFLTPIIFLIVPFAISWVTGEFLRGLFIISAQLMYYDAIIVDELGLGGDEVTTYMFLAIAAFSAINPIAYAILKRHDT